MTRRYTFRQWVQARPDTFGGADTPTYACAEHLWTAFDDATLRRALANPTDAPLLAEEIRGVLDHQVEGDIDFDLIAAAIAQWASENAPPPVDAA